MTEGNGRRSFVQAALAAAAGTAVLSASRLAHGLQHPQPIPSPNAPTNQNAPAGLNNYPMGSDARPAPTGPNPVELKHMVDQLYELAAELKAEFDKVDVKSTLPIDFVQRAKQIEKLAKAIRTRTVA